MPSDDVPSTDEQQIRTLVEQWAEAVHRGDLAGVLRDHGDDIVMFDVPPPFQGVRGIDAYRATWPLFFTWQAQGAEFAIESLEVTAGADVAFAHALLRCGTAQDFAEEPALRLRLTLGLRRRDGRWEVTHEHHSFPDTSGDAATRDTEAEHAVRGIHRRWSEDTAAKDLDGLMAPVAEDVVSYEHAGPLGYLGRAEVREVCRRGLDASPGPVAWDVPDLTVRTAGDLAVAWGLEHIRAPQADGGHVETWSRATRVFERRDGSWVMVHQHLSFPLPDGS